MLAPGTDSLLRSPLTAALSLLVTRRAGGSQSRAELLDEVVDEIGERWSRGRSVPTNVHWVDVIRALRRLALQWLRGDGRPMTRREVRAVLAGVLPDQELSLLDAAGEAHFGLLSHGPMGYEFPIRLIAEHLAGQRVAIGGEPDVFVAARSSWGGEVARSAIETMMLDPSRAASANRILAKLADADPSDRSDALRGLAVAAWVVGHSDAVVPEVVRAVCLGVERELLDETSSWTGDVLLDPARALAMRFHEGDALGARLAATALRTEPAASWYRRQTWEAPAQWLELLLHRDATVRLVAVQKIAARTDDDDVVRALAAELDDGARDLTFALTPTVAAGIALRSVDRARIAPLGVLGDMIQRLTSMPQALDAAGAAAFLRPGEAPAKALAVALHTHLHSSQIPRAVVDELAATEDGAAALSAEWPDWRSELDAAPRPSPRIDETRSEGPAPSLTVRVRIARVLAGTPAGAGLTWAIVGPTCTATDADVLVSIAESNPERVVDAVRASRAAMRLISPGEEEALRSLAPRYPPIADALLSQWPPPPDVPASFFPGRAIELLAEAGDLRALRAYREWLRGAPQVIGPFGRSRLSQSVIGHPEVVEVALAEATRIATFTIDGREEGGSTSRLAPSSAGSCLWNLASAWRPTPLRNRLLEWGTSGDHQRLAGVLHAFDDLAFTAEEAERAGGAIARIFREPRDPIWESSFVHFTAGGLLTFAVRAGLAEFMEAELEHLQKGTPRLAPQVALALGSVDPRRFAALSAGAATKATAWDLGRLAPDLIAKLVDGAPSAWAAWVRRSIEASPGAVHGVAGVLRALPRNQRVEIARRWATATGIWELPWLRTDWDQPGFRLADIVRGILYTAEAEEKQ